MREQKVIDADLRQIRRSVGLQQRRLDADDTVAVEVLTEGGFHRLQRIAGGGQGAIRIRKKGARAVDGPEREIVIRRVLPGDVIAAAGRHGVDRSPGAEFAARRRGAAEAQFGPRGRAMREQKIIDADLRQIRRSVGLQQRRLDADDTVAVEVLTEGGFHRLQRVAGGRQGAIRIRKKGARAVDGPERKIVIGRILPGDLIAAARGHCAYGRPGAELAARHRGAPEAQFGPRRRAMREQ